MILGAIHRDHGHVRLDRRNRRRETVAVEAVRVQIIRRQVGRANDHHTFLEHHLKQPAENDRVADVIDEQFIEAQHAHFAGQLFGQGAQRIGDATELERTLMHPAHEVMKVLTPRWHPQAQVELIHQPGLAAPDRPPQVHAADRTGTGVQGFMAFLQGPDRVFLGFILDETLVVDCVLPGTEGESKVMRGSMPRALFHC